jgi:hyperosmotically inducible periplasmic protein
LRRYYLPRNPVHTMKKSLQSILALLAISSGLALLPVGCAGTSTRESTGEYVDDAGITTKVKAAFVRDPVVKALDVKVETFKAVVQLSGFVDTPDQKNRAEQIARGTPGVQSVKNNISIK